MTRVCFCYLLNIEKPHQLFNHYAKGAIFENYVLAEFSKIRMNLGLSTNMYYWKNNHNKEVDCILETGAGTIAFEIKSAGTFSTSFFENLQYWKDIDPANTETRVVYGGDKSFATAKGKVLSWNNLKL